MQSLPVNFRAPNTSYIYIYCNIVCPKKKHLHKPLADFPNKVIPINTPPWRRSFEKGYRNGFFFSFWTRVEMYGGKPERSGEHYCVAVRSFILYNIICTRLGSGMKEISFIIGILSFINIRWLFFFLPPSSQTNGKRNTA